MARYAKGSEAALRTALSAGINLIDTSSSYGNGEAEELVGKVVHDLKLPRSTCFRNETHTSHLISCYHQGISQYRLEIWLQPSQRRRCAVARDITVSP
jgi:hypothetical protein